MKKLPGFAVGLVLAASSAARAGCAPDLATASASTPYDPSGSQDAPTSIAVAGNGNVFVAGYEVAGGNNNWRIRKYDATLSTLINATDYNAPANGNDSANALVLTASGDPIVVGSESATNANWRIRWYHSSLNTQFGTTDYNGPGNGDDSARAIAIGGGEIVVAGYEAGTSGGQNWRIRRYDGTFALLGTTDYNGPGNAADSPTGLAIDGGGNIYVVGYEVTSGQGQNWRIRKYDATLTVLLGSTDYNSGGTNNDVADAVALDAAGNVFVVGYEWGSAVNWRIRKYNPALTTLLASAVYTGPSGNGGIANAVVIDGGGDVFVAGQEPGLSGATNWRIIEYGNDLSKVLASADYNGEGNNTDIPFGMAFDATGDLYIAGDEFGNGGSTMWRVRRHPCVSPPVAEAGKLFGFPNPVAGDAATLPFGLSETAEIVVVDLFNSAMQRALHAEFRDVAAVPGTVTLAGLGKLAPGVYLARATARYRYGKEQTFPLFKLVVKR